MSRYKTPESLRRALEDRLLALVRREGGDVQRWRRQTAFDRLLCRLFHESSAPWLINGGKIIWTAAGSPWDATTFSLHSIIFKLDAGVNVATDSHIREPAKRCRRLSALLPQSKWSYPTLYGGLPL